MRTPGARFADAVVEVASCALAGARLASVAALAMSSADRTIDCVGLDMAFALFCVSNSLV